MCVIRMLYKYRYHHMKYQDGYMRMYIYIFSYIHVCVCICTVSKSNFQTVGAKKSVSLPPIRKEKWPQADMSSNSNKNKQLKP